VLQPPIFLVVHLAQPPLVASQQSLLRQLVAPPLHQQLAAVVAVVEALPSLSTANAAGMSCSNSPCTLILIYTAATDTQVPPLALPLTLARSKMTITLKYVSCHCQLGEITNLLPIVCLNGYGLASVRNVFPLRSLFFSKLNSSRFPVTCATEVLAHCQ
jgi:hypothetical protein